MTTIEIRFLISKNKTKEAINQLIEITKKDNDLKSRITMLSGQFNRVKSDENMQIITYQQAIQQYAIINNSLLGILTEIDESQLPLPNIPNPINNDRQNVATEKPNVFISYNHNDKEIANNLRDKLRLEGIDVTIDSEAMLVGQDIKLFIEDCIKKTNVTLSLISRKSLMSAWVAMETINTHYHQQTSNKKFIPCYIEDVFFDNRFRLEATKEIRLKIKEITDLIKEYIEMNMDPVDLNGELNRLHKLDNNLGEILNSLRSKLCIDIQGDNINKNFSKIIEAIKK